MYEAGQEFNYSVSIHYSIIMSSGLYNITSKPIQQLKGTKFSILTKAKNNNLIYPICHRKKLSEST